MIYSRRVKFILSVLFSLNLIFVKLVFFQSEENSHFRSFRSDKEASRELYSYHFYITSSAPDFQIIQQQYFQILKEVHQDNYERKGIHVTQIYNTIILPMGKNDFFKKSRKKSRRITNPAISSKSQKKGI